MFDFYISLFRSIKNANFMISPYLPPNLCSKSVEQLPIKIDLIAIHDIEKRHSHYIRNVATNYAGINDHPKRVVQYGFRLRLDTKLMEQKTFS